MKSTLRKVSAVVVVGLTLGLLAGCASIDDGDATIYSKEFSAAHKERYTVLVGKVPVPQTRNVPDRWYIYLSQDDETFTYEVTEGTFEQIQDGDIVCIADGNIVRWDACNLAQ